MPYSINPWMTADDHVDTGRAIEDWSRLRELLVSFGADVEVAPAVAGLPDLVFAADVGVWVGSSFYPSTFRHPQRAGEVGHACRWMRARGFNVESPSNACFESGDAVPCGRDLVVATGPRTDRFGLEAFLEFAREHVDIRVRLHLYDERFYHLGTALSFLREDVVAYFPSAFTPDAEVILHDAFGTVLVVAEEDAMDFSLCHIVVGDRIVVERATPRLCEQFGSAGFEVIEFGVTEFRKSGAGLRCLVLPHQKLT